MISWKQTIVAVALAWVGCAAAEPYRDLIYSGSEVVGAVDLMELDNRVANGASLCSLSVEKVTVKKVHKSSPTVLESFFDTKGVLYFAKDLYSVLPNAVRYRIFELVKPGAKLRVTYETCGRSPERYLYAIYKD